MSVGDARVYTCKRVLYTITMVYTFTKLYYRRIPNFGVGVRVGPMEFQLYHTTTDPNLIHTARHDASRRSSCVGVGGVNGKILLNVFISLSQTAADSWHTVRRRPVVSCRVGRCELAIICNLSLFLHRNYAVRNHK